MDHDCIMGNLMGWESNIEESGFGELGSDCEGPLKNFLALLLGKNNPMVMWQGGSQ